MDSDAYDAIMGAGSSPIRSPTASSPSTSQAREGSSRSSPTSRNPPAQTPTPSRLTTSGSISHRKRANSDTGLDVDDPSPTDGPPLKRLRLEEDVTQYYEQIVSGSKLKSPGSLHLLKTYLEVCSPIFSQTELLNFGQRRPLASSTDSCTVQSSL